MNGNYLYSFNRFRGERLSSSQEQREQRARRRRPGRLFHISPYSIKPNRHIKPRWCAYQTWAGCAELTVYAVTSVRRARSLARHAYCDLCSGQGGWGGISPESSQSAPLHGLWIYRVRATGPLNMEGPGEVTTSFPVRVLEVVDKYASPEKNSCRPPAPMTDEEAARCHSEHSRFFGRHNEFARLWAYFQQSARGDSRCRRYRFLQKCSCTPEHSTDRLELDNVRRVFDAFSRAGSEAEARHSFAALVRQENRQIAAELAHLRRVEHRKLRPDRRYKRERFDPGAEWS